MASLLKQAEKNVLRITKDLHDTLSIFDALAQFGNRVFEQRLNDPDRNMFFDGLSKMRQAVYGRYIQSLSDCFLFAGVGGKDLEAFSRQLFEQRFDPENRIVIMNFLEYWGNAPSSYSSAMEEQLRKEAMESVEGKNEKI